MDELLVQALIEDRQRTALKDAQQASLIASSRKNSSNATNAISRALKLAFHRLVTTIGI